MVIVNEHRPSTNCIDHISDDFWGCIEEGHGNGGYDATPEQVDGGTGVVEWSSEGHKKNAWLVLGR
ncbi:hypothetical protein K466DRAFT_381451 [Polyporus arcularius HHB13444]|uniref:Uncharacterized protein n=1 Tax=Polyporus arcularius HHB13444 TaxID=1314778 RepID=A0A5C3PMJ9_9APHY|nr:hypothetical protein K466DRAFT_381451 [Polyporus arcularius HHB13444]